MIGTSWGLPTPEPWTALAICQQTDPEAFFPESGESSREAKAVCLSCPVIKECLAYALRNDERHGVWGGTTRRERCRMPRPVRVTLPGHGDAAGTEAGYMRHRRSGETPCRACSMGARQAARLREDRKRAS